MRRDHIAAIVGHVKTTGDHFYPTRDHLNLISRTVEDDRRSKKSDGRSLKSQLQDSESDRSSEKSDLAICAGGDDRIPARPRPACRFAQRIVHVRLQSVTGTSTTDVQYDPAGNETERGAFQYNARNQLSVIADPDPFSAPRITYGYDGRGLRVSTLTTLPGVPQNWGSRRRRHVYSPELHLLAESDWTSPQTGPQIPGALQGTEYIWLGDEPVAQTFTDPMSATRYTFTDPLNTPLLQTDGSAAVVWRAEYEPYGDIYAYRAGDAADPQRLRLPGQEAQEIPGVLGTDLYYNIFRWYRAGWGRYTQADPYLEPSAEEPNQYTYAGQNPARFRDRFGLFKIDGSCDCGEGLGQNIYKAAAKACSYTKKPACVDLVKKLSPGGKPLDQCLKQRCSDDTLIVCKKDVTSACGSYSGLSKNIYLFKGHSLCLSAFKEMGYAPTIS